MLNATLNLSLNTPSLEILNSRKTYTAHLDINGYSQEAISKQDNWSLVGMAQWLRVNL